ncbi:MAG: hypothetical protein QOI88_1095 [Gammaproteobacteria bacterium]|jgi:hypothetical protein|nr:hypothetical protein [Gammaproteobacteria bacterium]
MRSGQGVKICEGCASHGLTLHRCETSPHVASWQQQRRYRVRDTASFMISSQQPRHIAIDDGSPTTVRTLGDSVLLTRGPVEDLVDVDLRGLTDRERDNSCERISGEGHLRIKLLHVLGHVGFGDAVCQLGVYGSR